MLTKLLRNPSFSKFESYKVSTPEGLFNYKSVIYKHNQKLMFEDGPQGKRMPLYIWKPPFMIFQRKYLGYNLAFAGFAYLLKTNPFYLTFPAAFPLMLIAETAILLRMFFLTRYYRSVVKEIWLHYGGETIEIVYAKQLSRKIQQQKVSELLFTPNIKSPPARPDMKPKLYNEFPEDPETQTKQEEDPISKFYWAWHKYYYNYDTYIVIPQNASYINKELLMAAFSGKIIQTNNDNSTVVKDSLKERLLEHKSLFI